jgi:hypothetical protein
LVVTNYFRFLSTVFLWCALGFGCMEASWLKEAGEVDAGAADEAEDPVYGDAEQYLFDVDRLYRFGVSGQMILLARHAVYPDETYDAFSATARFYNVLREPDDAEVKKVVDTLDGINDCGLEVIYESGSFFQEEDIEWLTAGEVTVSSGAQWAELAEFQGSSIYYETFLSDHGLSPLYGGRYAFAATGALAPAINVTVEMPSPLTFTEVNHADVTTLPTEDLVLEWTGGDSQGTVRIFYSAALYTEASGGYVIDPPFYDVTCVVDDDGRFVMPAAILSKIPRELSAKMMLRRSNAGFVDASSGKMLFVSDTVSSELMLGL